MDATKSMKVATKYDVDLVDDLTKLVQLEPSRRPPDQSWLATVVINVARVFSLIFRIIQDIIEGTINFLNANGGVFGLFKRLIFAKDLVDSPMPDSFRYLSIIAFQDPRVKLYQDIYPVPQRFPHAAPEARVTADVCIMAAKMVYENEAVVKKVVEDVWKMHLVQFCSFYNEYLHSSATQLFICADTKENPTAIIVAFRGTEPFNAYDWATDFNFELMELDDFAVHTGFLSGLYRADESKGSTHLFRSDESRSRLKNRVRASSKYHKSQEPQHEDAYGSITKILNDLIKENPNSKIYITGHSLGGALAALYAALLHSQGENEISRRLEAVYTFGQPRVGDYRFAGFLYEKMKHHYYRVVYSNDIVPRVGPDSPFKHNLPCNYYNCLYTYVVGEEPHRNFWEFPFIWTRTVALIELVISLFGKNRETNLCLFSRVMALALPTAVAHSPVNYVNAIRGGKTHTLSPLLHPKAS